MNTFGHRYRVTVIGESHGQLVGAVIDGVPAGLPLDLTQVQRQLDRRRPGQSALTTSRAEADRVRVLTGLLQGVTTGAPLTMVIDNTDTDSSTYERFRRVPRPGHADHTAKVRYGGFNDHRGGGMFSGRLTAALVMGGAVAQQALQSHGITIAAHVADVGGIAAPSLGFDEIAAGADRSDCRCAHGPTAERIEEAILQAREEGDSLGGTVEGWAVGVPPGLGDPLFHKVDGLLGGLLFSLPAVKAVAFGAGMSAAASRGSQFNDPYTVEKGKVVTSTNNAGGVLGGVTTGMPVVVKVVFKPASSITKEQRSVDLHTMQPTTLRVGGRHDPCIVPRAVPVVEACMALVLFDLLLGGPAHVHRPGGLAKAPPPQEPPGGAL